MTEAWFWQMAAFAAGTAPIVFLSWRSLGDVHSHGYYRFLAFEAIWALIILNVSHWFVRPGSLLQAISWVLLIGSAVLVIDGFLLLKRVGQPPAENIEATTRLVAVGIYRFIRHPLYASLMLLCWGVYLKHVTYESSGMMLLATLCLIFTAAVEERENRERFGDSYIQYMKQTKRFIPYVF